MIFESLWLRTKLAWYLQSLNSTHKFNQNLTLLTLNIYDEKFNHGNDNVVVLDAWPGVITNSIIRVLSSIYIPTLGPILRRPVARRYGEILVTKTFPEENLFLLKLVSLNWLVVSTSALCERWQNGVVINGGTRMKLIKTRKTFLCKKV